MSYNFEVSLYNFAPYRLDVAHRLGCNNITSTGFAKGTRRVITDLVVLFPEDEVLPGERLRVAAAVGDGARRAGAPARAARLGVAEGVEAL